MKNLEKNNPLTFLLFCIYLTFLTWIIIFKMEISMDHFIATYSKRVVNITPYHYMNIMEVSLNIIIFIPFGVYSRIIFKNNSFFDNVLYALFLSFIYESTQYIFAIGTSDITDLINNTLGAIIGLVIFKILNSIFKNSTYTLINLLSTIVILSFIYFLYKYNLI